MMDQYLTTRNVKLSNDYDPNATNTTRYDWAAFIYCARPSHTDRHFVSTASCVETTLALPAKKLRCYEIETNISSAYEN